MTEPVDDAQEDKNHPIESTSNSRKSSNPAVHDATLTRRPRPFDLHVDHEEVNSSPRVHDSLPSTLISRMRPATSAIATRNKSTSTLKLPTSKDRCRTASDTTSLQNKVQASASTIFSRTIQDLESLLNEALNIAQSAADGRPSEAQKDSPKLVEILGHGQNANPVVSVEDGSFEPSGHENLPSPDPPVAPRVSLPGPSSYHHLHQQASVKPCGPAHQSGIEAKSPTAEPQPSYVLQYDWAQPSHSSRSLQQNPFFKERKHLPLPDPASTRLREPLDHTLRRKASKQNLPGRIDARNYVRAYAEPPIPSRSRSKHSHRPQRTKEDPDAEIEPADKFNSNKARFPLQDRSTGSDKDTIDRFQEMFGVESSHGSNQNFVSQDSKHIDLNGCRHVDIKGPHDFNVHDTWRHQPVARDWTISRKRFAATIACINTALIGIVIGIYAGEVPAIQYVIVDLHHYTILGNVVLYLGLAIPSLFLWPLPLMHGRKPYTVMGLAVALCLQIPQGMAVTAFRSPYVSTYRQMLLVARAASGFALGFVNINQQASLLDVFGASLQSGNPHQEVVDPYDVRRHGGGMGLWLGLWSWCAVGSISIGFFIGTLIVDQADVAWGFWTSLVLMMMVLLLNIMGPEVRRSAYRRTVAEVMGEEGHISRVSRGEVKMHLKSAGPYWWGEEVKAGMELCWRMFQQPGFAVLAVYIGWAYAHFTLILMLLGALASRYYRLQPIHVGGCVLALGIGALLATPFQKASCFSRARHHRQRTDSLTVQTSITWSSHLLRRATFTLLLPFGGLGYALASRGPSISVAVPTVFAGCVGFLSNLAIAECQGIIMETYDTSDLQPGMTGRPNRRATAREREQRTKFTCYPRVSAGFAISQSLSFCFAAIATGVCGRVERRLGAMQATGIVAGALAMLTLLLTVVLLRLRVVQMIPDARLTMDYLARSKTEWEPVVLGRPSGTTRRISILEAGKLTRWSEIRRRNRLTG